MDDICVQNHVIQRLERRWLGRLEQLTKTCVQPDQENSQFDRPKSNDGWPVLRGRPVLHEGR